MGSKHERPEEAPSEAQEPTETDGEDPTASQLFFGRHLVELVADDLDVTSKKSAPAADSPSMLFFGESLEKAVADSATSGETEDETAPDEEAR